MHQILWELLPFFSTSKNGFRSISFEKIIVLHSYLYTIYNHKMQVTLDLG